MSSKSKEMCVGFVGAGRMATALARGLERSGFVTAERIVASDVVPAALERFSAETGARTAGSNQEVLNQSDVVFLAVKPQQVTDVLAEIGNLVTPKQLVISIAAGIPIRQLTAAFGDQCRLVRVMPNTPCLIGAGASAYALGTAATVEDGRLVKQMLETVGIALAVPEHLLDAVTGLSGSGPAYVYQVIEALSDGGVQVGLPRDIATQLAAQTVSGSARMVLETGQHPAVLKDAVTSPGGTTIAGLYALEQGGLRSCLMAAVDAATRRSRQLGQSL